MKQVCLINYHMFNDYNQDLYSFKFILSELLNYATIPVDTLYKNIEAIVVEVSFLCDAGEGVYLKKKEFAIGRQVTIENVTDDIVMFGEMLDNFKYISHLNIVIYQKN